MSLKGSSPVDALVKRMDVVGDILDMQHDTNMSPNEVRTLTAIQLEQLASEVHTLKLNAQAREGARALRDSTVGNLESYMQMLHTLSTLQDGEEVLIPILTVDEKGNRGTDVFFGTISHSSAPQLLHSKETIGGRHRTSVVTIVDGWRRSSSKTWLATPELEGTDSRTRFLIGKSNPNPRRLKRIAETILSASEPVLDTVLMDREKALTIYYRLWAEALDKLDIVTKGFMNKPENLTFFWLHGFFAFLEVLYQQREFDEGTKTAVQHYLVLDALTNLWGATPTTNDAAIRTTFEILKRHKALIPGYDDWALNPSKLPSAAGTQMAALRMMFAATAPSRVDLRTLPEQNTRDFLDSL